MTCHCGAMSLRQLASMYFFKGRSYKLFDLSVVK